MHLCVREWINIISQKNNNDVNIYVLELVLTNGVPLCDCIAFLWDSQCSSVPLICSVPIQRNRFSNLQLWMNSARPAANRHWCDILIACIENQSVFYSIPWWRFLSQIQRLSELNNKKNSRVLSCKIIMIIAKRSAARVEHVYFSGYWNMMKLHADYSVSWFATNNYFSRGIGVRLWIEYSFPGDVIVILTFLNPFWSRLLARVLLNLDKKRDDSDSLVNDDFWVIFIFLHIDTVRSWFDCLIVWRSWKPVSVVLFMHLTWKTTWPFCFRIFTVCGLVH